MAGYRILIVEDDQKMKDGLRHIMRKEGYCVDAVNSGEAALKKIKAVEYDLIISDLKLPGISGMDVLKAIKQYNKNVFFIIITAYGTVDNAVSAMKEGAEDYILKPFDMEEMRLVVRKTIEKRGLTGSRTTRKPSG